MKLKFKTILAMSLLVLAMQQCCAAWRKPVMGTAAIASSTALGKYFGDEAMSQSTNQQTVPVAFNPVAYPKATEFKNYNAMAGGTYKLPSEQVKLLKNQKNQVGMSGLREATKKLLEEIEAEEELDDEDSIEGLTWSQLNSDEQRLAYLKHEFKDCTIPAGDPVLMLLLNLIKFRRNLFPDLRESLTEFVVTGIVSYYKFYANLNSNILSVDVFEQENKIINSRFVEKLIDYFMDDSYMLKRTSYHEGAHALVCTLLVKNELAMNLSNRHSILGSNILGGHFNSTALFLPLPQYYGQNNIRLATEKEIFNALRALQLDAENMIMMKLAGGIGDLLLHKYKKVPFKIFENVFAPKAGLGTRGQRDTDMYQAYQAAESYIKWKHFTRVSQYQEEPVMDKAQLQQEVDELMEEMYEKTWVFLTEHKDKLDLMAQTLLEKREISTVEIYKIAGVERPKFNLELTFAEKFQKDFYDWLFWTGQRLKFFEEQHA